MQDELDEVAFLTRSPKRLDILHSLQRRAMDLRDLSDDLGVPRTTLNDNLNALEEHGWVERTNGTYRVTTLGRCVDQVVRGCRRSLRTANELAPFFRYVPADSLDFEVGLLAGAEVVTSTFPRPYEPVTRFVDAITSGSSLRASGPMVTPVFDALHEGVVERGLDAELLVTRPRYETLRGEFDPLVEDCLTTGRLRFGIRETAPEYGIALVDGTLVLGGLDEDGLIRTIVETDGDDAVEWAEDVLRRHRDVVTEFVE